jgi:hypothetical protein
MFAAKKHKERQKKKGKQSPASTAQIILFFVFALLAPLGGSNSFAATPSGLAPAAR